MFFTFIENIEQNVYNTSSIEVDNNNNNLHIDQYHPPIIHQNDVIQDGGKPTIIWWRSDSFYPHEKSEIIQCPRGQCHVTNDPTYQHAESTRAFVFYGTSFRANDLPLPRLSKHEWALFHEESPKNNWLLSDPLGIR